MAATFGIDHPVRPAIGRAQHIQRASLAARVTHIQQQRRGQLMLHVQIPHLHVGHAIVRIDAVVVR